MSSFGVVFICAFSAITTIFGDHVHEMQIAREPVNGFLWKNCNKSAPFYIKALSVSPDPVQTGSPITVSFTVDVKRDIGTTSTLQADIEATLKTPDVTIAVCDYVSEATCHPRDLCKAFAQVKKCPEMIEKLVPGCKCPLKKKLYTVTNVTVPIPSVPVSGHLHVNLTVKENQQEVGCYELDMCLGSCTGGIDVKTPPEA